MNFDFFNKIEKVLADATMLIVLFAMLLIPISSVGLTKFVGSDVLSKKTVREKDAIEPSNMPSSAGLPEEFESTESTQSTAIVE